MAKKTASSSITILLESLLPLAETDPRSAIEGVERVREHLLDVEGRAFRTALERSGWFEMPAAALLGMERTSLQSRIGPRGRHRELGEEARKKRKEAGYTLGRGPGAAPPGEAKRPKK